MRLSHVTLFVADMARSRAFYAKLGFELIVDTPHYSRFITEGDATLSIEKHDGEPLPARVQIGLEFASAAALDAKVGALRAAGVAIADGPADRRWLWRDALIIDPDGHQLLLLHAGENKLNPPWRVGRSPEKS